MWILPVFWSFFSYAFSHFACPTVMRVVTVVHSDILFTTYAWWGFGKLFHLGYIDGFYCRFWHIAWRVSIAVAVACYYGNRPSNMVFMQEVLSCSVLQLFLFGAVMSSMVTPAIILADARSCCVDYAWLKNDNIWLYILLGKARYFIGWSLLRNSFIFFKCCIFFFSLFCTIFHI